MKSKEIAYVRAGTFYAWFDKVEDHYEIEWTDGSSERGFVIKELETAKDFWHREVIERKQFKHCYCC